MTWRMPAETAPHERTWMAFPRPDTLGDERASADEARRRLGRGRERGRRVRAGHDGRRPVERRPARGACSRPRSSIVEAPLDEYWMRDIGPTFVLDDERPGVLGAVDWIFNGWGAPKWATWDKTTARSAGSSPSRRRRARLVAARERGRRHPRRRRGHRAAHRDRAARSAPQPVRRQGPRRGGARPHDRRHEGRSGCRAASPATTRTSARAATSTWSRRSPSPGRVLLHWQHEPRAPRLRGRCARLRAVPVAGDGCRGPQPGDHRPARARDPPRRRGLRRLELRQPPRRQRRRDRVRLRRGASGCRGARDPRRRLPRPRVSSRSTRGRSSPRGGGIHCITQQQPAVAR